MSGSAALERQMMEMATVSLEAQKAEAVEQERREALAQDIARRAARDGEIRVEAESLVGRAEPPSAEELNIDVGDLLPSEAAWSGFKPGAV